MSCALTIGALWDTSKYKKVYLSFKFTILVSFILVTYPARDRIGLVNTVPTVPTVGTYVLCRHPTQWGVHMVNMAAALPILSLRARSPP